MNRSTVLIVDDHPLFRQGAKQLLEMDDRYECIGEAAEGNSGMALVNSLNPDIVLLDLNMKEMSGLDVLTQLKNKHPDTVVVILTVSNQASDIAKAIRLGADGYLLKDMEPEQILVKLSQVAEGQIVLDDTVTTTLANLMKQDDHVREDVTLTERELEILALLVNGLNNKLIAKRLGISDGTVKVHIKHILRKIKVSSRLEAAVWAINNDLTGGTT